MHSKLQRARRSARVIVSLSLLYVASTAGGGNMDSPAASAADTGLPNFRVVDKGIYRGGQPTPAGWAYLKSLGIKTVVKLDLPKEGSDDDALRLGMTVVDASGPPSDLKNFWEAPAPDRIRLAVRTLEDEKNWPVYVHCLHGQDRTGLVVALYRVHHDHYKKSAAYREMRKNGFHPFFVGLLDVWEDFDGRNLP